FFFFFQAEDGIRDFHVTGVQTCALPIFGEGPSRVLVSTPPAAADQVLAAARSAGVPAAVLGAAGGGRLAVTVAGRSLLSTPVDHLPEPGRGVKPPWAPRQ